jgi:hypothetical protein
LGDEIGFGPSWHVVSGLRVSFWVHKNLKRAKNYEGCGFSGVLKN